MRMLSGMARWMAGSCLLFGGLVNAGPVCPDSSSCSATFTKTFTGDYRAGEPMDVVAIGPTGIESFADAGITIHVVLRDCGGQPVAGVPAASITLSSNRLCICPGGNLADSPTDANGHTTFTATLYAGGCATSLQVRVDGITIGSVPVLTCSTDNGTVTACSSDYEDQYVQVLSHYGSVYGDSRYRICGDVNKGGHLASSSPA